MTDELDKILRDFGEDYWSDIEHGDGDHSITITEATNTIQALMTEREQEAYRKGFRDALFNLNTLPKDDNNED